MADSPFFLHPSAEVEDGATIGDGTKIWHLGHIRTKASIGRDCTIGRNVFIDAGVSVGDRVKIQNNVSVYAGVTIEDEVFVGPSAVFTNDLRPRATNPDWAITETLVRRGASIGANATIVCGVVVGEHSMVAAGSVVTRDVMPYQLVAGNPARHLGWVDKSGEVISRAGQRPGWARTPIAITSVVTGPAEEEAVLKVLRSGQLAQGPVVAELEERFARLHGVPHAVAVSNGTVALVAALKALGVGPGDEVITTPFSFVATLNAIVETGATVRFADILDDYTIDPASVRGLITDRTRVLLPVHLYGLPADMVALARIAEEHGLQIIEDAAQAHSARIGERAVGSWGVGTFSLYATKNLHCGEGGIVTTGEERVADRLRLLRNQGMRMRYQYEVPGHNWRLTDLQAAVALPQLDRLAAMTAARAANAALLNEGLAGVRGLVTPPVPPGRSPVWHQYTVRLTHEDITRDVLAKELERAGIGYGFYYPRLMHDYDCFRDNPSIVASDPTPRAELISSQVVSLPVHQHLSESDVQRIVAVVREVLDA